MMSAASSGGVLSRVTLTASTIADTGSSMASRISSVVVTIGLRQAGDEVAAADLGVQLLLERAGRTQGDLDLLGRALAEGQAVLLLDELDDRLVELVAADAHRLAGDDAAEGDDRHLGGAAADVDDHVAGRLVDGQAGADGRGHGLLDDVGRLAGPGVLGRLLTARCSTPVMPEGTQITMRGLANRALVHPADEVARASSRRSRSWR